MRILHDTALSLLVLAGSFIGHPALAQNVPGTAIISGCKAGTFVRAYKRPGAMRPYARFSCGASVYVWNAGPRAALVQQETTVAYVDSKHLFGTEISDEESPWGARVLLAGIADGLRAPHNSAFWVQRQLVQSCLATRGCRAEAWLNLGWKRISRTAELPEAADSTLRFFVGGVYYSAFVVHPPVLFKNRPVPGFDTPVVLLEGGGLSVAVVDHACYTLGNDGGWYVAGASAGEATAAIH